MRFAFLGLTCLACLLGGAADDPQAAREIADIERDMQTAHAAKNYDKLGALAQEAAALETPAAYRAIIKWACKGDQRELEFKAFNLLKDAASPEVRAIICQEAQSNPNFKTRIILVGVCFQHREDPAAFAALVRAVKDPTWQVAVSAVQKLRDSKDPARAVTPLIEALEVYERAGRERLKQDIRNALKRLTGFNMEAAAEWKSYMESRGGKVPPAKRTGLTQVVRPKFFSVAIESDRILFIIDTSDSMKIRDLPPEKKEDVASAKKPKGLTEVRKTEKTQAQKAEEAAEVKRERDKMKKSLPPERERLFRVKTELARVIELLPENTSFTVMTFNNEIQFGNNSAQLMLATSENKHRMVDWVKKMPAQGETWTDTAFTRALEEVKNIDTIYLLSDGAPRRNNVPLDPQEVLETVKVMNRFSKCRIHTIGFLQAGSNLRKFLQALAREHDGTYTELE